MIELNDWDIILKVKKGDSNSFSFLIEKYSNRLFQFLYARLKNKEDIEDILQESFLKAFKKIEQYNPKYKFSTWIYTIVYHEFCRHIKKNGRLKLLNDEDKLIYSDEKIVDLDQGNVWAVARKLKPDQFTILWLKYEEELSVQEISVILKVSKTSVKVGLHRARNKLKIFLNIDDQLKSNISIMKPKIVKQELEKMI
ncbi:MAG: hypothetical protein COA79_03475 [Planctomycetota bacterium]|nr:MAG: hypothetical protein COA79_03475 [Planctomycetota bacterium]